MALPEGKVSEKDPGQTEGKETQVSEQGLGQTNPQPDDDVKEKEIDLSKELTTKFILNPKRPETAMTAEQIREAVGRGKLVSQKESELHKTQAELEQIREENEKIKQQMEMLSLNRQIQEIESRSSQKKKVEEDVFNFDVGDEPPMIDAEKVVRQQVDPLIEETRKQMAAMNEQLAVFQQKQTERERQEAFQRFGQTTQKVKADNLRRQFTTINAQEVDEIIANEEAARRREMEAESLARGGRDDEAMDLSAEATTYRDVAIALRTQAVLKEQRAKQKKEAEDILNNRSSSEEFKITEDLTKIASSPKAAEEKHRKLIELARKREELRKAQSNNLG